MKRKVCTWLASYLPSHPDWPEKMLRSEEAAGFLLIWPIYEQHIFRGFLKENDIYDYATHYERAFPELCIDEIVRHFHTRYQNKSTQKNMRFDGRSYEYILKKPYEHLSNHDKMRFAMYVVYRYRNNIFHGNKRIEEWPDYEREINDCLQIMMALMDWHKRNKGELT